jgi:hypothetical protein
MQKHMFCSHPHGVLCFGAFGGFSTGSNHIFSLQTVVAIIDQCFGSLRFDADPDPEPTFHFDDDPDPDPTPRIPLVGKSEYFYCYSQQCQFNLFYLSRQGNR